MAMSQAEGSRRTFLQNGKRAAPAGGEPLALGLGLFSLGLGLAEVAAPAAMAKLTGMPDNDDSYAVLRAAGVRELASGVGILTNEQPAGLLWSRVAGDVMDLMVLAGAARAERSNPERLTVAAAAVLGVTVLDLLGWRQHRTSRPSNGHASRMSRLHGSALAQQAPEAGIRVTASTTVNKPREAVYRFWRDLQNLPRFMSHLEEVRVTSDKRSHWKAKAPAGLTVEWDAELTEDRPGELLAWRSLEPADVANQGSVRFVAAAGGRGTEMHVELQYDPPGGVIGATLAKLFGEEPGQQVRSDLRRFKQVMETGEVLHSDASVHRGAHPASPSEKPLRREGMLLGSQLKGA